MQTFMYLLRQARTSPIGPEYPKERPKPATRSTTLEEYFAELGRHPCRSGVTVHAWPIARTAWVNRPEHDPQVRASLARVIARSLEPDGKPLSDGQIELARRARMPIGRLPPMTTLTAHARGLDLISDLA